MKDIRLWDQRLVAWHSTAVTVEIFTGHSLFSETFFHIKHSFKKTYSKSIQTEETITSFGI